MMCKQVKRICIQQFLQLIHLDCLRQFIWDLAFRTNHCFHVIRLQFCHINQGRDRFQSQLFLLNQGQAPLHLHGMMRSCCLLQYSGTPHSIIPPIPPLFANLVSLVGRERICPHTFACVPPPILQPVPWFVVLGVLLKNPLPPGMFQGKSCCVTPTGGDYHH